MIRRAGFPVFRPRSCPLSCFGISLLLTIGLASGSASGSGPGLPNPSPYALRPALDLPLIALGVGLKFHSGRALAETRSTPLDLAALDRRDLHPMDRWAAGNYSPVLSSTSGAIAWSASMAPFVLNGLDLYRGRQTWFGALTDVVLLQEALAISMSAVSYSKAILKLHPTPLTYGSSAPEGEKLAKYNVSSFFSGHTTGAFTTAVFTGYTYQLKHKGSPLVPWVWGGSLAAAGTVGAMRIAAGKHFPSDILAGAAVGSLFGYLIPRLHLRSAARKPASAAAEKPDRLDWDFTLSAAGGSSLPVPTVVLNF